MKKNLRIGMGKESILFFGGMENITIETIEIFGSDKNITNTTTYRYTNKIRFI